MSPNNCAACDYSKCPHEGGHCYMFRNEPEGVCMQHTGRKVGTIAHVSQGGRASIAIAVATILAQRSAEDKEQQ